MTTKYTDALNSFKEIIELGVTICCSFNSKIMVYDIRDYIEADETGASEEWNNYADGKSIYDLSLKDALENEHNLDSYMVQREYDAITDSLVNGQYGQAESQLDELDEPHEYLDQLDDIGLMRKLFKRYV